MIRPSNYKDILPMFRLAQEVHKKSIYKDLEANDPLVKRTFAQLSASKTGFSWVSEIDGEVVGFLVGSTGPIALGLKGKQASDILFYVSSGPDGRALAQKFIAWGWKQPGVKIVGLSNSSNIEQERVGQFYTSLGLTHVGGIYLSLQDIKE